MLISIAQAQPFGGVHGSPSPLVDTIWFLAVLIAVAVVLYAAFFGNPK